MFCFYLHQGCVALVVAYVLLAATFGPNHGAVIHSQSGMTQLQRWIAEFMVILDTKCCVLTSITMGHGFD